MKRIMAIFLAFLLAAASLAGAAVAQDFIYGTAVVNNPNPADRLNLRVAPNAGAASLGKYYNGVEVVLLSDPAYEWVYVSIAGVTGYMNAQYLAVGAAGWKVRSAIPTVYVNSPNSGDRLHLRISPSSSATSLGRYYNGTPVEVLGIAGKWYHVRVDGNTGYMNAQYLTSVDGGNMPGGSRAVVNNPNAKDRLHMRVLPNQNATSLGKYYNGVEAEILSEAGTWVKVRIGNLEGYMMKKYLATGAQANSVRSAIPLAWVVNNRAGERLNLREAPSQKAASLGKYYNGAVVEVLGFTDTWAHVRVDGMMGFMQTQYLQWD